MSNASPTAWWGTELLLQDASLPLADAWLWSILASGVIGLAGVVPLFIIPYGYSKERPSSEDSCRMQVLLSFAVGSLLGDVFLHLLPEAWHAALQTGLSPHDAFKKVGLWVLLGIFVFIVVEVLASAGEAKEEEEQEETNNNNGGVEGKQEKRTKEGGIQVVGYLNLLANGIDNFAHGLAVAGSFMVSFKTGVLTTAAILIHEVPHEVGDFAILLTSGFTRWEAAKAQLYTAFVGLLGALFTLSLGSSSLVDCIQLYILSFTAGAFLNISLVSVLPPLLTEARAAHSTAQFLALLLGVYVMASVAC